MSCCLCLQIQDDSCRILVSFLAVEHNYVEAVLHTPTVLETLASGLFGFPLPCKCLPRGFCCVRCYCRDPQICLFRDFRGCRRLLSPMISHLESAGYLMEWLVSFGASILYVKTFKTGQAHTTYLKLLAPAGFCCITVILLSQILSHVSRSSHRQTLKILYKLSATRYPHLVNLTTYETDLQSCMTAAHGSRASDTDFTDRAVPLTGFSLLT